MTSKPTPTSLQSSGSAAGTPAVVESGALMDMQAEIDALRRQVEQIHRNGLDQIVEKGLKDLSDRIWPLSDYVPRRVPMPEPTLNRLGALRRALGRVKWDDVAPRRDGRRPGTLPSVTSSLSGRTP